MRQEDENNTENLPVQPDNNEESNGSKPVSDSGEGGNNSAQPDNGGGKKGMSNFAQRCITSIFIVILFVAPVLLGFYVHVLFYDALIVFLMLVASYEFGKAISVKFAKPIMPFVYTNIVVGYAAYKIVDEFVGHGNGGITTFFGVLAVSFIACIVYNMCSKKNSINNVVSTLFVMIYPGAIMTYLLALLYINDRFRIAAVLLAFLVSTFTDTMAYLVGSTVKGPKLCPKISPKKTISGAIGGLFGGVFAGLLVYIFSLYGILGVSKITEAAVPNVLNFIFVGLGASLFCQIGDLISSYIKRACSIKDFGNILKGHGGFMDRIDGLIIAAVFIFIYFKIAGVFVL